MTVIVNGEKQELPASSTVLSACDYLGISGKHLVAELNLEILSRDIWSEKKLSEGDHLEFIGFVGGGQGKYRKLD